HPPRPPRPRPPPALDRPAHPGHHRRHRLPHRRHRRLPRPLPRRHPPRRTPREQPLPPPPRRLDLPRRPRHLKPAPPGADPRHQRLPRGANHPTAPDALKSPTGEGAPPSPPNTPEEANVPGVAAQLVAALGTEQGTTDPAVTTGYAHDEAEWAPSGTPAVRAPYSAAVATAPRSCAATGPPLVGRGAGTGLSGAAHAADGWVVVSFDRMTRIRAIDTAQQTATVQPGLINDHLRAAAAEHGLWYPPDPASSPWSTIGGNVNTNAGGLCCVKYGVTRDYVLGLQAVTADATTVRLGRTTAKGVTGYDLCGLMVGSEGTLGLITEITLRLVPARTGTEHTIVGYFDTLTDAGRAVAAISADGIIPSALELIDRFCLQA